MSILGVPISTIWTQFFPPQGPLGEANLPRQADRVFVVTGGTTGLGFVLARILYGAGGKVYMLTRSQERAEAAIAKIKASCEGSGNQVGSLEFIYMDLADFATVKSCAEEVLRREGSNGRLDVLFNNAGTGGRQNAPPGRQGYEYHLTTNSLGSYLLTRLLMPLLAKTAQTSPRGSVRVVWAASVLVELNAPQTGFRTEWLENPACAKDYHYVELYSASKTANWFLASEFARRFQAESGVLHIAGNPGSYNTNMWQYSPWYIYILSWPVLRGTEHGADTYLWMGFSDSVTLEDAVGGRYATCDGRWHPGQRDDLMLALRNTEEGGSGRAAEVYDWCARATGDFLG